MYRDWVPGRAKPVRGRPEFVIGRTPWFMPVTPVLAPVKGRDSDVPGLFTAPNKNVKSDQSKNGQSYEKKHNTLVH